MVWQRAGTVSVQNGSTTVTGAGVDFAASSRVGDSFVGPDGATYEVANVASSTVISILPAYKGPTVSGAAYAIMPVQGYDKMLSDAFNSLNNQFGPKLAALGTTGNYDILPITKGGTGGTDQAGARSGLGLGSVSIENVVPVTKGGTGGNTQATARTELGLGSASTATVVSSKVDNAIGRVLNTGYCGIGGNASNSAPLITDMNQLPVGGLFAFNNPPNKPTNMSWGTALVTTHGDGSYGCLAMDNLSSSMAFRAYAGGGDFSPWAVIYTTANTTRAADGTLKAI